MLYRRNKKQEKENLMATYSLSLVRGGFEILFMGSEFENYKILKLIFIYKFDGFSIN